MRGLIWRGNARDVAAGALFVVFGAAVAAIASGYRVGSLTAMGPGFMPIAAGVILAAIGLVVLGRGLLSKGSGIERINLGLIVLVVVPVMAFGYLLERFGLIIAASVLVLVSRIAAPERSLLESIVLAVVLTALTWGIFVLALGLPLPIVPEFL